MADATDPAALEPFLGALAQRLAPAARRKLALALGRHLRKVNAARITRNVQPDGSPMEPRKRRADAGKGRVRGKARMFRKIGKARSLRIKASPDGVQIGFAQPLVASTAAVHHFGDVGYVGKTRGGRTIRTRYAERRLLGFGPGDLEALQDTALDHLAG